MTQDKQKDIIVYIVTVVVSALLIAVAWFTIAGGESVFKGTEESRTIRAEVLRVLDTETTCDETGAVTFEKIVFQARALETELKDKTIDVFQDRDKTFAFCPEAVAVGDKILVEEYTESNGVKSYYFGDFVRITPLVWLFVLFCALVLVFGKLKGLNTLISLAFTCLSVFLVLIPAILNGRNIYLWSILVCVYITVMTLLIISGASKKSLCACVGCVGGVLASGLIVVIMDKTLKMTGLLEDESVYLVNIYPDNPINLKAIIFAMIIVGAVGAVMDVAMSISSSLAEIKAKSPDITPAELIRSGFTIGRDMLGTMANTLVLAYIGSSLTTVLLLVSYNSTLSQVINREIIIADILQALAGSTGILLALPLTSAVCAAVYNKAKE